MEDLTLTEALRYGSLIGNLAAPPEPRAEAERLSAEGNPVSVRLMALGWSGREVVLLVYVLTLILSVAALFLAIVKGA